MYETAAASAAQLIALDNTDEQARDYRAFFVHNIGRTKDKLGERPAAISAFKEAYETRVQLHARDKHNQQMASWMEDSLRELTRLMHDDPALVADALPYRQQYYELQKALYQARPAEAGGELTWLEAWYLYADALRQNKQGEEAAALAKTLIAYVRPRMAAPPNEPRYRHWFAYASQALPGKPGDFESVAERQEALLEEALALREALFAEFPQNWLFYSSVMASNFQVGKHLAAKGHKQRALELVRRAADLGYGDAVGLLEKWYRTGAGPVRIDVAEAGKWKQIRDKHNFGMKRFTAPVTFIYDQFGTKYAWHIYIRDPYAGRNPVDDFIHLTEYWTGAVIPQEIQDSFRRLLKIAEENNVSFQDLCVYAIGDANKGKNLGTFPTDLQVALLTRNPVQAKDVLHKAAASQTASQDVVVQLVSQNSFDQPVLTSMQRANQEPPKSVRHALLHMAHLMLQANDANNALLIADALLQHGLPENVPPAAVLSLKGWALIQIERWEEAERVLLQSLSLDPFDASTLNRLGYEWTERDLNLPWARELLERAHKRAPDNASIRNSLGWNYVKLGMVDQAIPHLQAAIYKLNLPDSYAHLGEAYRRIGKSAQAKAAWLQALEHAPNEALKSWITQRLAQLEAAAEILPKAR